MAPFGSCFFNQHSNFRPEHPFLSPQKHERVALPPSRTLCNNRPGAHFVVFSPRPDDCSGVFGVQIVRQTALYRRFYLYPRRWRASFVSCSSPRRSHSGVFFFSFSSSVTTFSPPRVVPKKIIATAKKNAAFIASSFLSSSRAFSSTRRVVDHQLSGQGAHVFSSAWCTEICNFLLLLLSIF